MRLFTKQKSLIKAHCFEKSFRGVNNIAEESTETVNSSLLGINAYSKQ
jgi:hypothetical protein